MDFDEIGSRLNQVQRAKRHHACTYGPPVNLWLNGCVMYGIKGLCRLWEAHHHNVDSQKNFIIGQWGRYGMQVLGEANCGPSGRTWGMSFQRFTFRWSVVLEAGQ